jgi:hypothetical protein
MNRLALREGKIEIRFGDEPKRSFRPSEIKRMGEAIAKHRAWGFMSSSSCDFPHENGFKKSFDVGKVLGKAVEYARNKLAVDIVGLPIEDLDERVESTIKKIGLPASLRFVKSGKNGESPVVTFNEENHVEFFTGGIRFARRVMKMKS